jgi:hypothetical protein
VVGLPSNDNCTELFGIQEAESFFDSDRAALLNARARLVIGFMKHDIIQLAHINHFSALLTFIEVPFLPFA